MTKKLKTVGKVSLIVLCAILALVLLVLGGLNLAKFAIYADYYAIETDVCENPGLSDGFVCQGICYYAAEEKILVSGYMMDHTRSRIYITDTEDNSYYVSISYGSGKDFTGHAGGIAVCGDYAYIASGEKIYAISIADLLSAENGDTVSLSKIIPVNNQASFIYSDGTYLYVGEFHDGKNYITDHPYETPDGTYYAIVSRYPRAQIEAYHKTDNPTVAPDKVYSIRNKVQGICFAPDGKVVASTSYGVADTIYYVYNEADAVDSGEVLDGAPVYYLYDHVQELRGPAMGEDMEYYNGQFLTLTESACNKYIFGKFFFATKIVMLDF